MILVTSSPVQNVSYNRYLYKAILDFSNPIKVNYHKIWKIKLEPSGVVVPGVVIAGVDSVAIGVIGTKMSYKRCLQRSKSECDLSLKNSYTKTMEKQLTALIRA